MNAKEATIFGLQNEGVFVFPKGHPGLKICFRKNIWVDNHGIEVSSPIEDGAKEWEKYEELKIPQTFKVDHDWSLRKFVRDKEIYEVTIGYIDNCVYMHWHVIPDFENVDLPSTISQGPIDFGYDFIAIPKPGEASFYYKRGIKQPRALYETLLCLISVFNGWLNLALGQKNDHVFR